MDDGSTNTETEEARQAVAPNGEYADAAFVDAMIPHHEGATEMAEIALGNAEHEEIRALAQQIEELGGTTMRMSGEGMDTSEDPRELAQARPFDRAFVDAMTPRHESAVAMANVALEESQNPGVRGIAEEIVAGQERGLWQMKEWREEWYPEA